MRNSDFFFCLCLKTQWEGFIHRWVPELSAQWISQGRVCVWLEASWKPEDSQYELEAAPRQKMNRELEYMFTEVSAVIFQSSLHPSSINNDRSLTTTGCLYQLFRFFPFYSSFQLTHRWGGTEPWL